MIYAIAKQKNKDSDIVFIRFYSTNEKAQKKFFELATGEITGNDLYKKSTNPDGSVLMIKDIVVE